MLGIRGRVNIAMTIPCFVRGTCEFDNFLGLLRLADHYKYLIMSKPSWRKGQDQIFEEDSEQDGQQPLGQPEEGQVVSPSEEGQVISGDREEREAQNSQNQHMYDSSVDNDELLQAEKRKRELRHRQQEEEQQKMAAFSEEDMLKKAMLDIERTNKRVMLMRKKNLKRMEDLQKVRMTQQPYLTSTNTHFRGSAGEYPLITTDRSGRTLYHPNYSLRVSQMRLKDFIQKNIREENTSNYLNQVVKFENYAYQQRKKRRQHIQ